MRCGRSSCRWGRWPPSRRTSPPRPPRRVARRRRTAAVALAGVAAAAIVLAATVWLVRGPSGATRATRLPRSGTTRAPTRLLPRPPRASGDAGTAEPRSRPRTVPRRRGCRDCSGSIPASSRTVPTADGSRGRCRRARCSPTSVPSTPTTRTRASGTASGTRPRQPARSSPVTSTPGPRTRRAGGLHLVGLDPGGP